MAAMGDVFRVSWRGLHARRGRAAAAVRAAARSSRVLADGHAVFAVTGHWDRRDAGSPSCTRAPSIVDDSGAHRDRGDVDLRGGGPAAYHRPRDRPAALA